MEQKHIFFQTSNSINDELEHFLEKIQYKKSHIQINSKEAEGASPNHFREQSPEIMPRKSQRLSFGHSPALSPTHSPGHEPNFKVDDANIKIKNGIKLNNFQHLLSFEFPKQNVREIGLFANSMYELYKICESREVLIIRLILIFPTQ